MGEDPFHDSLSLAYKFTAALISANLYPQKQNVKKDTSNKQENLMNSNKQSCSTIKNILIPEEPCTPYQNPPLSVVGLTNETDTNMVN